MFCSVRHALFCSVRHVRIFAVLLLFYNSHLAFVFSCVQVKFFDFLNKAQIKAAKQISNALSKEASAG